MIRMAMACQVRQPGTSAMGHDEPMTAGNSDRINAARQGDAQALGEILEPFRDYLNLMASRGIGPGLTTKAGASDLVQETFLAAQKGIAGFRGSTRAEWRAWLEAILANQLANLRRSYLDTQKRREGGKGGGGRPTRDVSITWSITPVSGQLQRRERDAAIEGALGRLPEHYRQVVRWHHDDGLTFEAIAARMGISAEAARKLWGRALVCLKRGLGPDHDPR
jgi:RNA polymerase sigma-70 factor (ECF subfamily)